MLGALARWLRAAGYDCSWQEGIADKQLIDLARREDRIILTSDTGIMKRNAIATGRIKALYVRRDIPRARQAAEVLRALDLPRLKPRCMACGGRLVLLDRDAAGKLVPPGALREHDEFYRCERCDKTYWPGTHWSSIDQRLGDLGLKYKDPSAKRFCHRSQ